MLSDVSERTDQGEIIAALASGRATGDGRALKRIDTHMSHLFLGAQHAYKLNRAVRHAFADMTSLAARRAACEAELTVNRVLAPHLYEVVRPVTREPGGAIGLGGCGEVVDYVVVMRRFADGALFDEIALAGDLTSALMTEAAETVARFHAGLTPHLEAGHVADYRRIISELQRMEADGAAELEVAPASDLLFSRLEHELARHAPLIEARRRAGWVRRGHGDLHLGNICLFEGRVTPFDALEFDPALATADVLYDLAFLLMDLRSRSLPDFANLVLNRYWDASDQPEAALALLPLFMGLRAAVRMAVAVERGDLVQASHYRGLGLDLLRPAAPCLVAIGGLSGTGKSSLARLVAPRLPGPCGARLLSSDQRRKAVAAIAPSEHMPPQAYADAERAKVYRDLAERAGEALGAGAAVVADATFREAEARAGIEAAAGAHRMCGVWLRGSDEVRLARVAARRGDLSDATPQVAKAQREPEGLGTAWRILDADRPSEGLAEAVIQAMAAN